MELFASRRVPPPGRDGDRAHPQARLRLRRRVRVRARPDPRRARATVLRSGRRAKFLTVPSRDGVLLSGNRRERRQRRRAEGAVMPSPLVRTKLYVPQVRRGLVARPRLSERLNRTPPPRLTLISAPPGFGKTTLLAAWLDAATAADHPVAWVSLEETEQRADAFWTYVVTALDTAAPGVGARGAAAPADRQPADRRPSSPPCSTSSAPCPRGSTSCSTTTTSPTARRSPPT